MASPLCFNHNPTPSQFYGDHMYDLHVHLQHGHLRHDVPHLEGEVHLVVVEFTLVFQVVLEQVYWKDLKQSEDCVNGEACCDGKALTRKQKSEQVRQDKEKVSNSDK